MSDINYNSTDNRATPREKNFFNFSSTSTIVQAVVSINGGDATKFDVSAGRGQIVDSHTDVDDPQFTPIEWTAFTAVTATLLATDAVTLVFINSSGVIIQQNAAGLEDFRDMIFLGNLVHPGNTVIERTISLPYLPGIDVSLAIADLNATQGIINFFGNDFIASGANLKLDQDFGLFFQLGVDYINNPKNPNIPLNFGGSEVSFFYSWGDGSGGFNTAAFTDLIDPTRFDDGTGGASTPNGVVGADECTIQRLYFSNSVLGAHYGVQKYKSIGEAVRSIGGEPFSVNPILGTNIQRTLLIVKGSATDLSDPTQARFVDMDQYGLHPLAGHHSDFLFTNEITTPIADPGVGKIYTKTDDRMYFQDGSGVEHEAAFAPIAELVTTSPFSITTQGIILADPNTLGSAITLNLPTSASRFNTDTNTSNVLTIKNIHETSALKVNLIPDGSETIDEFDSAQLSKKESLTLAPDGSDWWII